MVRLLVLLHDHLADWLHLPLLLLAFGHRQRVPIHLRIGHQLTLTVKHARFHLLTFLVYF